MRLLYYWLLAYAVSLAFWFVLDVRMMSWLSQVQPKDIAHVLMFTWRAWPVVIGTGALIWFLSGALIKRGGFYYAR